jgi:hypothetical protein
MKKSVSKETKPAIKNLPADKKPGRGGARPGAGRARYVGPMKPFNCDLPEVMLDEIKRLEIKNKTEYIAQLIVEDMKKKGVKKTTLSKIEEALTKIKP